jgi:hypothetical protein
MEHKSNRTSTIILLVREGHSYADLEDIDTSELLDMLDEVMAAKLEEVNPQLDNPGYRPCYCEDWPCCEHGPQNEN